MSMRDEIVQLIYENLWQDEWNQLAGVGDAADAIMELVQARIDEQVAWVRDLATDLNNAEATIANQQARIDELEQGLRDIKDYALGRATAALKGSDT